MTLLQPSYLWGLLALSIPIAIHLWSRRKVRNIKVGSTQFIAETKSKQSNSIQLNEWWLLAVRCSVIGTVVFILAQPHITKTEQQQDLIYIFEPSLLTTEEGRARFVQIPTEARRLLSSGFPEWDVDKAIIENDEVPNYWQLARQMEQLPADSIVVFTNAFAKAVKGKRPKVKANVNWIPVDLENSVSEPLMATRAQDSVDILRVQSDAHNLAFSKTKIPNSAVSYNSSKDSVEIGTENGVQIIPLQSPKALVVSIIYDKTEDAQLVYMEAAFRAIAKYTNRNILLNTIEEAENISVEESDYLLVLDNRPIPDVKIPTLLYRPDILASKLIVPGTTATISFLTKKLTPQIVVEEHLVEQILHWLQLNQEIGDKIDALDMRSVSTNHLQTKVSAEVNAKQKALVANMSDTLWILLLLLLVGERLLAKIRKQ